jgi:phosphatidylglycerol:prolipoprotein diacylglycerol transferase
MNPTAFEIFGLPIQWYGIIISIGIVLAYWVGSKLSKLYDVDFEKVTDIFIVALPVAILCARLYYVIFEWPYYKNNPSEILNIRGGGLAIHGGVLGAIFATYIMAKIKKIEFVKLLDIAAPCFILGQAIGRWGNFFNSEAHGGPVSEEFISRFPDFIQRGMFIDGTYYHPTFLYESIWNICIFALLIVLSRRKTLGKGSIFYLYMILYSVGRFFIEGLRTDSLMIGPLRIAQVISIVFIVLGTLLFIYSNKNLRRSNKQ